MREASSRRSGCGTSIEGRPRSRPPRPFAPHHVARRVLKAPALFAVARLLPQRPSEFLGFRDRRAWRPYRAWGYPITFLIFLAVACLMMYYLVTNRPVQSLAGFGMMIAGLAVYYASRLQDVLRPRVTRMLRKAGVAAMLQNPSQFTAVLSKFLARLADRFKIQTVCDECAMRSLVAIVVANVI